ncbi:MAG: hypothetical protein ABSH07_11915 [Candidatus Dormibacteria bacterium]
MPADAGRAAPAPPPPLPDGPPPLTHIWRWRARLPERFGERCQVEARGARGTILVRFADGFAVTTSWHAVRRAGPPGA